MLVVSYAAEDGRQRQTTGTFWQIFGVSDPTHRFDLWWARVDLNHQPRPYQEADLRHMFVRIIGFPTARTIEGSLLERLCGVVR